MVKYPIFVLDDTSYISVAFDRFEQVSYLEPIDIDHGIYAAYDSEGYRLKLAVSSLRYDADYTISRTENLPAVPDELREHLVRSMEIMGIPTEKLAAMPYDELIEYARTVFLLPPSGCSTTLLRRLWTSIKRLSHKDE